MKTHPALVLGDRSLIKVIYFAVPRVRFRSFCNFSASQRSLGSEHQRSEGESQR